MPAVRSARVTVWVVTKSLVPSLAVRVITSPSWVPGVSPTTAWMPSASSAASIPPAASAIARVGASLPAAPPGLVPSTLNDSGLEGAELLPAASLITALTV
ncbi:hypothetical protein D3C84_1113420 [compost metagenome]